MGEVEFPRPFLWPSVARPFHILSAQSSWNAHSICVRISHNDSKQSVLKPRGELEANRYVPAVHARFAIELCQGARHDLKCRLLRASEPVSPHQFVNRIDADVLKLSLKLWHACPEYLKAIDPAEHQSVDASVHPSERRPGGLKVS
jgi:hypothetical protein